jgi:uncharacterized protein
MKKLALFENQQYLNLETFRRTGKGVPTPVWFVETEGKLYVRTIANSGKIKRIRNFEQTRVAPCDSRGNVLGEWSEARARVFGDEEAGRAKEVNRLLKKKYGALKLAFDLAGRLRKQASDTIEIELVE